jgi:peptide/nickel transport system substrate-binding protein
MRRRTFVASGAAALSAPAVHSSKAQGRAGTLLVVSEGGPNNLDIHGVGTNVPGYEVAWNCYDRLITHAMKTLPDGTQYYDRDKIIPELAEDMKVADMSVTFRLRSDAAFQDGSKMTAQDVKWSFDRAVTVGGFPTFQMKAGSLEKPEQFVVVDDRTIRVDFLRRDRLTIPDLGVVVPCVMNSNLVKQHATAADPWGLDYTKMNVCGSGPYRVTNWTPGTQVVFERNEKWNLGPKPQMERVIWRVIPDAGNRRALLERGDSDISYDLPPKDFAEVKKAGKLKLVSVPYSNGIQYLGMNVAHPPFDNPLLRRAVGCAVPYDKIMQAVLFGLGKPLYGGPAKASDPVWPQPGPYGTDMARGKQLMEQAGHKDGFDTQLSFDMGSADVNEPMCVLIQESLAQIGIRCTINKIPGATWRTELNKKVMPIYVNVFSGWLDYPEYFFFWCYDGQNAVFNTMSYISPTMDHYIDDARAAAAIGNTADYDKNVVDFVDLAWTDLPRIPLYQPYVNVAMQPGVSGYRYWFHRRLDYKGLVKS